MDGLRTWQQEEGGDMTTKEFLSQAYRADRMVNAKLGQAQVLRELAAKATTTLSDMPRKPSPNLHSMEDTIVKMLELESEIVADINTLLDLKKDITAAIKKVENPDYQVLLELRYLCFKSWSEVADDMKYSKAHILTLHRQALDAICKS